MFGKANTPSMRARKVPESPPKGLKPKIASLNPRNPQEQRNSGQTKKDDGARGNRMAIRSLRLLLFGSVLFTVVMLALSAASFRRIVRADCVSITIGPRARMSPSPRRRSLVVHGKRAGPGIR